VVYFFGPPCIFYALCAYLVELTKLTHANYIETHRQTEDGKNNRQSTWCMSNDNAYIDRIRRKRRLHSRICKTLCILTV